MKRYFIGNWKMNHLPAASKSYIEEFSKKLKHLKEEIPETCENVIGIAPPFTSITEVKAGSDEFLTGAQNCHWHESGAYTGEVSAQMLKSIGVDFVICGHSERRQYFAETNETCSLRAKAAIDSGMKAIVCVGETAEQFEAGASKEIVETQLLESLSTLSSEDAKNLIVAYEPVWAIGTGLNATPEIAQSIHSLISDKLNLTFGDNSIPILYGGSTKGSNIAELIKEDNIDGALVGGASLKPDDFIELIKNGSS